MTNQVLANADARRVLDLLNREQIENATDVVEEIAGTNHRYARELLGMLVAGGLARIEETDEGDVWKVTAAGAKALAQQTPNVVYLNQNGGGKAPTTPTKEPEMATKTKNTAKTTKDAKVSVPSTDPRFCGCGCGSPVAGKSTFRQGHDARMVSQLVAAVVGGNASKAAAVVPPALADVKKDITGSQDIQWRIDLAAKTVNVAFGEKLSTKAYSALMNGWQRYDKPEKAAKPAKAAKAPKTVKAKVGRWTKEGHLTAEGDLVTKDAKGNEQIVAKGKYALIED